MIEQHGGVPLGELTGREDGKTLWAGGRRGGEEWRRR